MIHDGAAWRTAALVILWWLGGFKEQLWRLRAFLELLMRKN
jgi:hypothetical protein